MLLVKIAYRYVMKNTTTHGEFGEAILLDCSVSTEGTPLLQYIARLHRNGFVAEVLAHEFFIILKSFIKVFPYRSKIN